MNNDPLAPLAARQEAAAFLFVSAFSMNVWDSTKRYDLKPKKIGRAVYYPWVELFRFISRDENDYQELLRANDRTPLIDRKRAAKYINATIRSVINWDKNHRHNLKPRLVGSVIRYRVADLDTYIESRMRP